jgi:RHS repeat-associated protein
LTAPDGSTTSYQYDSLNRLNNMTNSATGQFVLGYDALSRRTSLNRPNGVNTTYTYNSLSRLLSVLHQTGGVTIDGASYTYDPAGNRVSRTNYLTGTTESYSYDPIYELLQVTKGEVTSESYSYDAVGNRLSSLSLSPYQYNSSNELTSTPSTSYTHDADGNVTAETNTNGTTQFSWDFENRLTQVTLPGTSGMVTFMYDPFGRRIYKSSPTWTGIFLYDHDNLIETANSSRASVADYMQDLEVDTPLSMLRSETSSYYEQDGLGSVTSLSNSAGALVNTYTYDTFGKLTASTGNLNNPFQYTAREFDQETDLYEYRTRYYDQNVGRFNSEDPIRFKGGIDFYRYVDNNPIRFTDPDGENLASCLRALDELRAATAQVLNDLAGFPAGGPDRGHEKTLQQAVNRLKNALAQVGRQCTCTAAEAAAAVAAAVAAGQAALDAAAPFLLGAA